MNSNASKDIQEIINRLGIPLTVKCITSKELKVHGEILPACASLKKSSKENICHFAVTRKACRKQEIKRAILAVVLTIISIDDAEVTHVE